MIEVPLTLCPDTRSLPCHTHTYLPQNLGKSDVEGNYLQIYLK